MSTEEILDYAVLHGNSTTDLSIKSFSNLEVRDFSEKDWISIFLDLMVSIMDVENPLTLRSQPATKGKVNPKLKCNNLQKKSHHFLMGEKSKIGGRIFRKSLYVLGWGPS